MSTVDVKKAAGKVVFAQKMLRMATDDLSAMIGVRVVAVTPIDGKLQVLTDGLPEDPDKITSLARRLAYGGSSVCCEFEIEGLHCQTFLMDPEDVVKFKAEQEKT